MARMTIIDSGCGMGLAATMWLLERGVRVVGTDGWSWDVPFSATKRRIEAEGGSPSLIWEGHRAGRQIGYSHMEKLSNLRSPAGRMASPWSPASPSKSIVPRPAGSAPSPSSRNETPCASSCSLLMATAPCPCGRRSGGQMARSPSSAPIRRAARMPSCGAIGEYMGPAARRLGRRGDQPRWRVGRGRHPRFMASGQRPMAAPSR